MPAISCYLSEEALQNVKAKAKAFNSSVSYVIRKAVENYLDYDEQKKARENVLKFLSEKKPLGGTPGWEEIHKERTLADASRG